MHDHWQGEACVALFGAIGFAIVSFLAPDGRGLDTEAYTVLRNLFPEWFWQLGFLTFGTVQLVGLRMEANMLRLAGACGILFLLLICFFGVSMDAPYALGLCAYLACIAIESCAIIYLTTHVVRMGEYRWWQTGKA